MTGIVLHWSAGNYTPNNLDRLHYHGGVVIRNNKVSFEKWNNYFDKSIAHTWHRNSRNIGLAICGMVNATENDWGKQPITNEQIEELCLATAEVAYIKNIDTSNIFTHAEMAMIDGYFGERWDLASLTPQKITRNTTVQTGDTLRKKIRAYKLELIDKKRKVRSLHYITK